MDSGELQFKEPTRGDTVAQIETSRGTIKVILYPDLAPLAVQNFILLSQKGYYNGLTFHRVVEDLIISSGSPDGTDKGGRSIWNVPFPDEFSDLLHNYSGAMGMANYGEDTNGSQFYFVTTPVGEIEQGKIDGMSRAGWRQEVIDTYREAGGEPRLDYRYTVFGQIYEGLDVAYDINHADLDENGRPKEDITINSVTVEVLQ